MSKLAILGGDPVLRPKQIGPYGGNPWKFQDLEEALCAHPLGRGQNAVQTAAIRVQMFQAKLFAYRR